MLLVSTTGLSVNVTNFKQKDYKAAFGDTLKSYYTLQLGDYIIINEAGYTIYLDGYYVELTVADADNDALFLQYAECILNSMMPKK